MKRAMTFTALLVNAGALPLYEKKSLAIDQHGIGDKAGKARRSTTSAEYQARGDYATALT